ncbi:hypothetical protein OV090_02520 [Nannocystis sp. RBIL2]|uniref:hypothetical protein n=1 Tax=Nannocystis sp. RBIL2 TaxID=2996788 RepID=UPI00226E8922|nr:hypothetical protein [Nannocystis sp. RBIL2]MCY1063616.1 hypothetical protein [Nannocystis sp. RBIL2]
MRTSPLPAIALSCLLACGDDGAAQTDTVSLSASDTTMTDATPTSTTLGPTSATSEDTGTAGESESGTPTTTAPTSTSTSTSTSSTTEPDTTTSTSTGTTDPIDTTTTGTTSTSTTTTSETTTDTTTGEPEACACPDDIEVPLDDGIFVLSDDAELWKYFPETNSFTMLGAIGCGMTNTFSMAVDRLGYAWVQFNGTGELRKVDVTNVSDCSNPGFLPNQNGVKNFGMAFVSNSDSDKCDRIYGNTYSGFGGYSEGVNVGDFLTIDPDDLGLAKLGKTNFDGAELTGTGDGRAFIFGGQFPSKLVEADKNTGAALDVLPLNGLEINNGAFAFAFFAGDFYFFTDSDNDLFNSEVTHLDYDDSDMNGVQDLTVLTQDAPLLVVGAGVSTCAPVLPM